MQDRSNIWLIWVSFNALSFLLEMDLLIFYMFLKTCHITFFMLIYLFFVKCSNVLSQGESWNSYQLTADLRCEVSLTGSWYKFTVTLLWENVFQLFKILLKECILSPVVYQQVKNSTEVNGLLTWIHLMFKLLLPRVMGSKVSWQL